MDPHAAFRPKPSTDDQLAGTMFDAEPAPVAIKVPAAPDFDGAAFEHGKDQDRLKRQLDRVVRVMRDGHWRTYAEIAEATRDPETGETDPEASISARLRDLRKEKFGGYTVERRRRSKGLFEYRVRPPSITVAP